MIGKIKGTVSYIENNKAMIDTAGGVCYEIFLPPQLLTQYTTGSVVEVITYLQVREDNLTLYGFENRSKYQLFQMLLGVDGVGPKSAFSITSHTEMSLIREAIAAGNVEYFSSVPGVGKKTAQKILLELSHKIAKGFEFEKLHIITSPDENLIMEALTTLGFKRQEISPILSVLDTTKVVEDRIRQAIQLLTKKH